MQANAFGRVVIEDVDGTDTSIEVMSLPPARPDVPVMLVKVTTFDGTIRDAPVFLDPASARALARALDEAADEADLLQLEQDNLIS